MSKRKAKWDYGDQEALHTAWVTMEMFEQYVAGHPKVIESKKLRKQAEKTFTAMWDMYQAIGGKYK